MGGISRQTWIIMCVVVLIILILVACTLRDNAWGAAGTAIGGAALLLTGREEARTRFGGNIADLSPANILAGAGSLGFPPAQKGHPNIEAQHHAVRAELEKTDNAVRADAQARLLPAGGWRKVNKSLSVARNAYSAMCDIIRGDGLRYDGQSYDWPTAPWRNRSVGGGRLDAWTQEKNKLDAAAISVHDKLKDAGGSDLPSKVVAHGLAVFIGTIDEPLVPTVPQFAAPPVAWGAADATYGDVHLLAGRSSVLFTQYGGLIARGPLKVRNNLAIDTVRADAAAAGAAAALTRLLLYYDPAAVITPALVADGFRAYEELEENLRRWAWQLRVGATEDALYGQLEKDIGGSADNPIAGSLRAAMRALRPRVIPALAVRRADSVFDRNTRHGREQTAHERRPLADASDSWEAVRRAYDAVRPRLDWTRPDASLAAVETELASLITKYQGMDTWQLRLASQAAKARVLSAMKQFGNDLQAANLQDTNQSRDLGRAFGAARAEMDKIVLAKVADVPDARNGDGVVISGVPDPTRRERDLCDPRSYPEGITDVAEAAAELARAVFGRSATFEGLNIQAKRYKREGRVDPMSMEYADVDTAASGLASAYAWFAKTGNPAAAAQAAAARADLGPALEALGLLVEGSPLVEDRAKAAFRRSLDAALRAAAALPPLAPSEPVAAPSGASVESRPLTESQRLIRLAAPPTEEVMFTTAPARLGPAFHGDVVLEASSTGALEDLAEALPAAGPRQVYGLVVDRPGDMTALYKAIAIELKQKPPPSVAGKVADRKRAATGWLYEIVRYESGAHYVRLRGYIKPEQYAVD